MISKKDSRERRRAAGKIEGRIMVYVDMLISPEVKVKSMKGVPLENLITDLFTQLRELEDDDR